MSSRASPRRSRWGADFPDVVRGRDHLSGRLHERRAVSSRWVPQRADGQGPFPGLLAAPRHGSVTQPPHPFDQERYVVLVVIHRGQRLADVPFRAPYPGLLAVGVADPARYFFRGIAADCLRAFKLPGGPARRGFDPDRGDRRRPGADHGGAAPNSVRCGHRAASVPSPRRYDGELDGLPDRGAPRPPAGVPRRRGRDRTDDRVVRPGAACRRGSGTRSAAGRRSWRDGWTGVGGRPRRRPRRPRRGGRAQPPRRTRQRRGRCVARSITRVAGAASIVDRQRRSPVQRDGNAQ